MPGQDIFIDAMTPTVIDLGGRLKSCVVKNRHTGLSDLFVTFDEATNFTLPPGDTFVLDPDDTFPLSIGTIKTEKITLLAGGAGLNASVVWTTWEVIPKLERGFFERLAAQFES